MDLQQFEVVFINTTISTLNSTPIVKKYSQDFQEPQGKMLLRSNILY